MNTPMGENVGKFNIEVRGTYTNQSELTTEFTIELRQSIPRGVEGHIAHYC